ncbi:hypothetical protein ACU4GR_12070 [Methylobacterium oryzae CBMB20]
MRARAGEALLGRAQTVESAVLLVRVANWRFLATFDPNGPATFARNLERAEAALKAFKDADGSAAIRAPDPRRHGESGRLWQQLPGDRQRPGQPEDGVRDRHQAARNRDRRAR